MRCLIVQWFGDGVRTHVSELDFTNFTQSAHNLSSYFVRDIELGQAHIRRAKEGVLRSHDEGETAPERCLRRQGTTVDEREASRKQYEVRKKERRI